MPKEATNTDTTQFFTLDPFGVSGLPSSRFNPLRYLEGDSMITDAQTFADALIIGDDYFSSSARQLLTGLILYVVAEPDLSIPSDGKKPDTSPAPDDEVDPTVVSPPPLLSRQSQPSTHVEFESSVRIDVFPDQWR